MRDASRTVGRLRDLGTDALQASGTLAPLHRRVLQGHSYRVYGALEELFALYERIVVDNAALAAPLAFEDSFKPMNAFLRTLRKGPLAESGPASEPAAYAQAGGAALQAMGELDTRSLRELRRLIEARVQRSHGARRPDDAPTPLGPGRSGRPDGGHPGLAAHAGGRGAAWRR